LTRSVQARKKHDALQHIVESVVIWSGALSVAGTIKEQ
jgi:hypothetical protein